MPRNININPAALDELTDIVNYFHTNASVRVAERFVDHVRKCFNDLAKMPELGAAVPVRRPVLAGIRCCSVKRPFQKYLVFYRFSEEVIEIVHVLHGSRDTDSILNG